ncbi:MAG: sigma 54-interacting transcriptional regulator [Polyangiaceae bacterium]
MSSEPPDRAADPFEGLTAGDPGEPPEMAAETRAYLLVRLGESTRVITLDEGQEVVAGRSRQAAIVIEHERVSRNHAAFVRRGGEVFVRDLGSRHGTLIGGRLLRSGEAALGGGDLVRVGAVEILVATASEGGGAYAAEGDPVTVGTDELVVADPKSAEVVAMARRLARAPSTVLLLGNTGVGKEVLARLIHRWSPRAGGPYVRINCAAIPETLLESELFGHERGAFTGADRRKIGQIEAASGGSLLLDEIAELSRSAQAKLLGVLENRTVTRVAATTETAVDVRLIAATHRDLRDEVAAGRFREDLYYRISTFTLRIPPLAERAAEIEPLAAVFARRFAQMLDQPNPRLSPATMAVLRAHAWPGNVRELRNAIEHAVVLAERGVIEPHHLPEAVRAPSSGDDAAAPTAGNEAAMRDQIEAMERRAIEKALGAEGGNQTRAARLLGISRRALTYKLAKYGFGRRRA